MSNQKKDISELGYAQHGYMVDETPHTLKEVEQIIRSLDLNVNSIKIWERPISDLLTMRLSEFIELQCACFLVSSSVTDFPKDLDESAYVFIKRGENNGILELVGSKTGYHYSRRLNKGQLSVWTPVQGNVTYYATFGINPQTGKLVMHTEPGYSGANFGIKEGNLIVTI